MEDKTKNYGLCPDCKKGYLVKEVLYEGVIFSRKKVVIFMCPFCPFKNKHTFKLNETQYLKEIE